MILILNKRQKVALKCDKRISILSEIIDVIKVIKMYCWENMFQKVVEDIRGKEIKYQGLFYLVTAISITITILCPAVMLLMSISYYLNFANMPLNPQLIVLALVNKHF